MSEHAFVPLAQLSANQEKWFTQREVAEDLGVTTRTLRYWLKALAQQGAGPSAGQVRIHRLNAARRIKRWRGDYWLLVVRTFYTMK